MKNLIAALALILALPTYSQNVIADFETNGASQIMGSGCCGTSAAIVPGSGTNTSLVAELTNTGDQYENFEIIMANPVSLANSNTMSMDFYNSTDTSRPVWMRLEGPGQQPVLVEVFSDAVAGWETLSFDFSSAVIQGGCFCETTNATGIYDKMFVFVDGGAFTASTTAIDNIQGGENGTILDPVNITFQVNMASALTSGSGVYVCGGGTFGVPGDNPMTDPDGDDIWEVTIEVPHGTSSFYAFANGNCPDFSCKEDLAGESCAAGDFNDRFFPAVTSDTTITTCYEQCSTDGTCAGGPPATVDITFSVNMAGVTTDGGGVFIAGGGNFGNPGDNPLSDADSDDVWEITVTQPQGFSSFYAFTNGNCPDYSCKEDLAGQSCGDPANFNDRFLPAVQNDTTILVCFEQCTTDGSCDASIVPGCMDMDAVNYNPNATVDDGNCRYPVTVSVDMNAYGGSFTSVGVFGNFNSWNPADVMLAETTAGSGVYETTVNMQGGAQAYKFILDGGLASFAEESLTAGTPCTATEFGFTNRSVNVVAPSVTEPTVCWESCDACPTSDVRITGVDTGTGEITLSNFGPQNADVSAWSFCNFPMYSTTQAANGDSPVVVPAGGSVSVTWPAAVDADGELGLYSSAVFGDPNAIVDYVEWATTGHIRSSTAIAAGVWNNGDFVSGASPYTFSGASGDYGSVFWDGMVTSASFCDSTVYHLGIPAETASAINLTIQNLNAQEMKVTISSADADAVDFLDVFAFGGPITGAPAISGSDNSVAGELSRTLTWTGTAPAAVEMNLLWSKASTAGNWQLGTENVLVDFNTTCPVVEVTVDVTFSLDMSQFGGTFSSVSVGGEFNGWNPGEIFMTETSAGSMIYEVTVPLLTGDYQYKFAVDGTTYEDMTPGDACTVTEGGFTNRVLTVGASDATLSTVCWASCDACPVAPMTAQFCDSMVTHLGIPAETASAINLSIANVNAQEMKVTISSADADPVDLLIVNAFGGPITGSPAVSGQDTSVPGEISIFLTWTGTPPAVVDLNILWSKVSTPGNWQLGSENVSVDFNTDCGDIAPPMNIDITVMVNMANQMTSAEGVYIAGGGNFGNPGDFQLYDDGTNGDAVAGDDIWTGVFTRLAGFSSFYTLTNGACPDYSCKEDLAGKPCGDPNNFNDRFMGPFSADTTLMHCFSECTTDGTCPDISAQGCMDMDAVNYDPDATEDDGSCQYNVTFAVDMSTYPTPYSQVSVGGTFNGFNPGEIFMTETTPGSMVYATTIPISNGQHVYKFAVDGTTYETMSQGDPCTLSEFGFTNRLINVSADLALDTVCWQSCSACDDINLVNITFEVNMATVPTDAGGVYIAGGGNFGNPGDNPLMDADMDDVWTITLQREAGFSSFYTFTNGACPDYSCKEDLAGLPCGDAANFNDRFLPAVMNDTTITLCFGQCGTDGECIILESNDDCDGATALTTSVWGQPSWTAHSLGEGESMPGCEGGAEDDIWFSFVAESSNDGIIARGAGIDPVIEVFDGCGGASLGCYNNYGMGAMERVIVGDLTPGQTYLFRVYDAGADSDSDAMVEVSTKTFEDGGLQDQYCDVFDYDLSQSVYAKRDDLGQLYANPNIPVVGYRFHFVLQDGSEVVAEGPDLAPYITLANVPGLNYDSGTLTVHVCHLLRINTNGSLTEVWSDKSTGCDIGLQEDVPSTSLQDQYCNVVDFELSNNIKCYPVPGATMYRFHFAGSGGTIVKTTNSYGLFLHTVAGLNYGEAYSVTVQAMVDGEWSPEGDACSIGLVSQPVSVNVQEAYCGGTYVSPAPNFILADQVVGATQYDWRFMPVNGGAMIMETTAGLSLAFHLADNVFEPGQYMLDVRVTAGGQTSDFGTPCTITIGGGVVISPMDEEDTSLLKLNTGSDAMELTISPNPNAGEEVMLGINNPGAGSELYTVQILDITGKLVFADSFAAKGEQNVLRLNGLGLQTGLYLIELGQGNQRTVERFVVK